jgi:hypothetical protein
MIDGPLPNTVWAEFQDDGFLFLVFSFHPFLILRVLFFILSCCISTEIPLASVEGEEYSKNKSSIHENTLVMVDTLPPI